MFQSSTYRGSNFKFWTRISTYRNLNFDFQILGFIAQLTITWTPIFLGVGFSIQLAVTRVDSGSSCVMGTLTVISVVYCSYFITQTGKGVGLGGWVVVFFLQSSLVSPSHLMYLSILSILTDSKRQSINGEFSSSLCDSDWKMFYFCSEPWTLCPYSRLVLLST